MGAAMAVSQNQKNRKNNSMLTKTGKTRLGPLNLDQLNKLLEKSSKPKEQAKIKRMIATRPPAPVVAEAPEAPLTE
jgi:hypothetical protein